MLHDYFVLDTSYRNILLPTVVCMFSVTYPLSDVPLISTQTSTSSPSATVYVFLAKATVTSANGTLKLCGAYNMIRRAENHGGVTLKIAI